MGDFGASEIALLASVLGGQAISGALAPNGQELQSFGGSGDTDPKAMLSEGRGLLGDMLTSLMNDAARPVNLKTTVNPLPSFVGGGLPMPISAPGMDANRLNPELRSTPGLSIPRRRLTRGQVDFPSGGSQVPPENRDPQGGDPSAQEDPHTFAYNPSPDLGDGNAGLEAALKILLKNHPIQT